jgi:XRE family transcriptional regulator, regulator of sulfur utilization
MPVKKSTSQTSNRTPSNTAPPLIGETIHRLRQAKNMSMDELCVRAGVSKSMLSQIERNQANPTVAIVWRLAGALDVPIGELLLVEKPQVPTVQVIGAHAHPSLSSPDGKCTLRILGPLDLAGKFEWYALSIEPNGCLESQPHEPGSRENLTVLSGALDVTSGASIERVKPSETARYAADVPHAIRNAGRTRVEAVLVVIHP